MGLIFEPTYFCRDCGVARTDVQSRDLLEPDTAPPDAKKNVDVLATTLRPCLSCGSRRVRSPIPIEVPV
jgi:hypothetical protein